MLSRIRGVLPVEVEAQVTATIGCAVEVHSRLGPGFVEAVYHEAMAIELEHRGLRFKREYEVPMAYGGRPLRCHRLDLLVEDAIVVELKAVEHLDAIHQAQLMSYLKATGLHVGLLMNFRSTLLKQALRRIVL